MEQPVQRSGMPRGCLIGLIIFGVIALILVIVFSVICMNRDKVLKWSMRQGVVYVKDSLSKEPVGIDTTRFNVLADSFLVRLEAAQLSDSQLMTIGPTFQTILTDKKVDSAEVIALSTNMIMLFPELSAYSLEPPFDEMPEVTDSVVTAPADTGQPADKTDVDSVRND